MSESFHRAVEDAALAENGCIGLVLNGWPVALARQEGKPFAFIDKCTHASSPLSTGRVRRGAIMCPLHGARFTIATGQSVGNVYPPLMTYRLQVVDGWIEVAVPDEAPGPMHAPVRLPGFLP
jgi:3-phenylpropionate/trans-cinnamate dioxygenase ferredoxin subunit